MSKQVQVGFTIIELAVVIAIIGILAAVAIPRFGNTNTAAEGTVIKDGLTQLNTAMSIYTAAHGVPASMNDFVSTDVGDTSKPLNMANFGPGRMGRCRLIPAGPTETASSGMICTGAFNHYGMVTYTMEDKVISVYAEGISGAPSIGTPSWMSGPSH